MDPYIEACRRLDRAKIPYLVIGVFGINLYAQRVGAVMTTADCDLLLPPDAEILTRAVRSFRRAGYDIEAGGEPLPTEDPLVMSGIVRARAVVRVVRRDVHVDLVLEMAGCEFADLWPRQRRFRIEGVPVRVAPLTDLIRSKERARRPKDRLFLETYRSVLKELLNSPLRKPRKR